VKYPVVVKFSVIRFDFGIDSSLVNISYYLSRRHSPILSTSLLTAIDSRQYLSTSRMIDIEFLLAGMVLYESTIYFTN
jgi:hypothetical protein